MEHASDRHGVVTRTELLGAGHSPDQIDLMVSTGKLGGDGVGVGVYRVAGAPQTFDSAALIAVLGSGGEAWASHRTAARLWELDLPHASSSPIELTRPYGLSASRRGVRIHRSTLMPAAHITTLRHIPITTPARTLFDLARSTSHRVLDRAVEDALRRRLCTIGGVHGVLAQLGGRGRPGTRRMRDVLATRDVDYVPTASELEAVGRGLFATVPGIQWEVPMFDRDGYIRRVDALVGLARLVIEFDGSRYHNQPSDVRRDASTDARLVAAGYVVVRFGWTDLTTRPDTARAVVDRLVGDAASRHAAVPA